MQEKIKILKVRFDNLTLEGASNKAFSWISSKEQRYITTPNPEIILEAQKNKKFLKILNKSNLNIPDGIGILWASKFLKITEKTNSNAIKIWKFLISLLSILFYPKYIKSEIKERVTGVDLMQTLCEKCAKENKKIFLLGAKEGTAEKVKEILEKKYPGIKITGTYSGSGEKEEDHFISEKINKSQADLLFVAYGASKQEFWIHRNMKKLKTVKIAIGIGESFNFIAGIKKRAPKWMQKIGLEWLYRLAQEPTRIKRIYNATIKFPIKVLSTSI
jgi:N-acetylglucosaminyldiphosphoundecaprenol N-acetyl-beta-D-mannosaminyltransferase